MNIGTININLSSGQPSMARAFLEAMLRSPDLNEGPEQDEVAPAQTKSAAPKIGEFWLGMGGIYAGIARGLEGAPDYHLILAELVLENKFTWQGALDHAKTITVSGHNDFSVPTRFESALLYANLQDKMDADNWHWTSTQFSEDNAWLQNFSNGTQLNSYKSSERRCRFVRRTSVL